jgi:F-type H+-transporting ATPase subunit b
MWTRTFAAITLILALVILVGRPAVSRAAPEKAAAVSEFEHGETGKEQRAWNTDLALWSAVVFLLLLAVLYKMAWGPLSDGLSKRERHIADQIAQANAANKQAQDLLAIHQSKLADAAQEVRAILDKARNEAEEAARQREAKAEADAKARSERAEKEIAAATSAAAKDLADRSARLAVDLAGKIVRAKINPREHAQLIEQAVNGFEVTKQGGKFASRN